MKSYADMTPAERVVYRISEIWELQRRLARAGRKAGLHQRPPCGAVREEHAPYDKGARSAPG